MSIITLTSEERTLYETRLSEAESAMHTLLVSPQARVIVEHNGERIEYSVTNKGALRAYIAELKALLGTARVCGPMTPWMI